MYIIDKRWKLCVQFDQSSIFAFINTVKENSGPLKTSLMNKTTYHEGWTTIKRKVLNGRAAIQNLFNLTGPSFQTSLDMGKCLDLMEIFIMVAKLVVSFKLHQFIEPEDIKVIAKSFLLFADLSEFHNVLS